jgi:5-methylcytosine-specific restriction endonuclease McrA
MFRNPNCTCKVCGKRVYRRPSQIDAGNVYCSSACTGLDQRIEKICKICSKKYIGPKKTCSRSCANTSRAGISYTKENKFNNAHKGTLLKEKVASKQGGICELCGMKNYAILQIHHKKERYKGGTDALDNLLLLCPNCHAAHHLGNSLYKERKVI